MQSSVPESDSPLDSGDSLRGMIRRSDPELEVLLDTCVDALSGWITFALREAPNSAAAAVVSQGANDFLDLLRDLRDGRGRPAVRSARGLLEHWANLLSVWNDEVMADRYLSHEDAIGPQDTAEADQLWGFSSLREPDRTSEPRAARRAVGRAARVRRKAVSEYGRGYLKGWQAAPLRSRLQEHGIVGAYTFYSYASAILHGSSAGRAGIAAQIDRERPMVHRTGPALRLCPLAYRHGLAYFVGIVETVTWVGSGVRESLMDSLREIEGHWRVYASAAYAVDRELWPELSPVLVPVLVTGRFRRDQWYLHDLEQGRVIKCRPPNPSDLPEEKRQEFKNKIESNVDYEAGREICVAVIINGLEPLEGDRWRDDRILPLP